MLASYDEKQLVPSGPPTPLGISHVLADSVPIYEEVPQQRWTLLPEVRRQVLNEIGSRAEILQVLEQQVVRPHDPVQRTFEAYIRGDAPPLEQQSLEQLAATAQVVDWLRDSITHLPDREAVLGRMEALAFLQPLRELVGTHFRGREKELRTLRDYVGSFQAIRRACGRASCNGSLISPTRRRS